MKKILSIVMIITLLPFCLAACQSEEMKTAIARFEDAVATLDEINIELDTAISEASSLIASGEDPLDKTLITSLETVISEAKAAKISVPEMPGSIEEILSKADEIYSIDYTDVIANLNVKQKDLEISIQRFKLVNHPDESYIIDCLKKVPSVIDISAVTEETDPMNNINKAGWYTAHVYFSSCDVDQSEVYGDSLIDKGTDAGGSIEVYKTVEEAEKRNEYLASFDGGTLASGSHIVVGTCVVRTSDELTATGQKNLETDIVSTLICLSDEEVTYLTKYKEIEKDATKPTEIKDSTDNELDEYIYEYEEVPEPVDRYQEAIEAAEELANSYFPTGRAWVWDVLVNPSLEQNFEAFNEDEAYYAIDNANINWSEHAVGIVSEQIAFDEGGYDIGFFDYMSDDYWFTSEEIEYACMVNGVE